MFAGFRESAYRCRLVHYLQFRISHSEPFLFFSIQSIVDYFAYALYIIRVVSIFIETLSTYDSAPPTTSVAHNLSVIRHMCSPIAVWAWDHRVPLHSLHGLCL